MEIEDIISASMGIPEEEKPKLIEYIKSFPQNMEKWFYADCLDDRFMQGDIITEVPFITFLSGEFHDKELDYNIDIIPTEVMILSNSCDIEHGKSDFITVAPMAPIKDLFDGVDEKRLEDDLIKNQKTDILYIPESPNGTPPESMVYLYRSISLPKAYMNFANVKKIASLSLYGWYFILVKLAWHFVRPLTQGT